MVQAQFLNAILRSRDPSAILVNNLTDEYFSDYKQEFRFIKNHLDQYGNIPDFETFLSAFPNFDVIDVRETTQYLIDALYEDRNKRKLASIFNRVRELIMSNKTDEALKLYTTASEDLVKATHLDCVDIIRDTSRYNSYVEKCNDYAKFYIKTGFPELDTAIGGWDKHEELATIVARTGLGKSWTLLKCAVAAAEQGLSVGIYSGEMSENKVGYRVDTLISHISNKGIIRGNVDIQNDYKRYIDNLKNTIKGSIKVLTPAMINGSAGVTALRAFIEKESLDILFIDQHSLLDDDRHAKNPVDRAANISKDLKTLQTIKKIPIISVSQQNREKTDTGVDTTHIAQSDRIAQDSTVIIFLEKKDNIMTLNLVKSRDSENGKKLNYMIDLDKGIFQYVPAESDAQNGEGAEELRRMYDNVSDAGEDVF